MIFDAARYASLLDQAKGVDTTNAQSVSDAMDVLHDAMMLLDALETESASFTGAPQIVDMEAFANNLLGLGGRP